MMQWSLMGGLEDGLECVIGNNGADPGEESGNCSNWVSGSEKPLISVYRVKVTGDSQRPCPPMRD